MKFDDRMLAYLDTLSGDIGPIPVEAEKLVALTEESDPAELQEWLWANVRRFVGREMQMALASERMKARRRARSRAFAEAGDPDTPTELGHFAVTYVVADDLTRRRVADMTGADHRYVARSYQSSAAVDLMHAAFHEAVAKKVGSKRTADVLDERTYDDLLQSIVAKPAA